LTCEECFDGFCYSDKLCYEEDDGVCSFAGIVALAAGFVLMF
jgi:hypothetical protein